MKNHFCLNLEFNPLNKEFVLPEINDFGRSAIDNWQMHLPESQELLSTECLDFFRSLDLEPWKCHLFCGGPGYSTPIHIDGEGNNQGPLWAVNWIYGSTRSLMTWYESKESGQSNKTPLDTPQVLFIDDQVKLIDSFQFDEQNVGPVLVRTDIPHKVVNQDLQNPRWCLSVRVKRKIINNWFSAVKHFKPYLVL